MVQTDCSTGQVYPTEGFISAQLLALIDSQAVKKFVIHSDATKETEPPLLVSI